MLFGVLGLSGHRAANAMGLELGRDPVPAWLDLTANLFCVEELQLQIQLLPKQIAQIAKQHRAI